MVAVLWEEGNKPGAIALENLWNAALEKNAFHLHCAYPKSFFAQDNLGLRAVIDEHTHILGLTPAA
jgi:hypothetical protein